MKFQDFHDDVLHLMREQIMQELNEGRILTVPETNDAILLMEELTQRLFRKQQQSFDELMREYQILAESYKELKERYVNLKKRRKRYM